MTTALHTVQSEWQRRIDLIENPTFISKCATISKEMGMTAKEWNENKAIILLMFANKYCQLENQLM